MASQNFDFLASHDPLFDQLAEAAERNLAIDPNTTLLKLRQLGEAFARHAAAASGLWTGHQQTQLELLRLLESRGMVEREVASMFHAVRTAGNAANHDFVGSRTRAFDLLKVARQLAIWFHRAYGGLAAAKWHPRPFVAPEDHTARLRELEKELALLKLLAASNARDADAARQAAAVEAERRAEAEALARSSEEEKAIYAQLAEETEARLTEAQTRFEESLAATQARGASLTDQQRRVQTAAAAQALSQVDLGEAETRVLIDAQLRAAGWEVDSVSLRYAMGTRPEAGVNRAIAEWPTANGPADYVLFRGLVAIGVVEAKKQAKNVAGSIEQAKRYSRGFKTHSSCELARPPGASDDFPGWVVSGATPDVRYRVPFLFAANGRAYLRQYEQESGVWFLDARLPTNHPRALADWYSSDGLAELIEQDEVAAHEALQSEPTGYLGLRSYQLEAIARVEEAIARGQRDCLVAMATGTGKTRTVIGLVYRLLKTKRFKRVLFLVDRSALGEQAQDAFKEMRLEEQRLFSEIFELKELADAKPDASTKVQVATVQGMVKRVLHPSADGESLPVDTYDCVIVDESHRGYALDRHMGEGEASMRDFRDYVSTYRRVLDHFDAVKIGLTATPALHTREIFGHPVFSYSYPEAVADGYLVDHEPPVRLVTKLNTEGIVFGKGTQVPVLVGPGQMSLWEMEDELKFEVDAFNRSVITEGFNRVVCQYLAGKLDPLGDQKTLVFCVNDAHADLFVKLMKEALDAEWHGVDDATVRKITGASDEPLKQVRLFKNEKLPNIAVTVDLLSTGIDVPEICNLVFVRRVRSRILYEQMVGRATRLCDRIGKQVFRIYDAVDLYSELESFTDMKPLVKDVTIPASQLLRELVDERSHETPSSGDADTHADDVLATLVERLRRKVRAATGDEVLPPFVDAARAFEDALGVELAAAPNALKSMGAKAVAQVLRDRPELSSLFERVLTLRASPRDGTFIAPHEDQFLREELALPNGQRPEDYLKSFERFVIENMNVLPALTIVAQRPRALTRAQLKELLAKLEAKDFGQKKLEAAWRAVTNEDVAAGVIGFIRRAALGDPLVSYEERVDRAFKKVLAMRSWTGAQKNWLDMIVRQMKREVVVDVHALDQEPFKDKGGLRRADMIFEGKAADVLAELQDAVWQAA